MKTNIQKWGNSLGIRIPSTIVKELSLENGSEVEIVEDSNQIVIKPQGQPNLKDMIDAIDETNIHSEVDFGRPEGKEIW
ncbi:AbrB/MazE/SpoVT family DNA-binding domain-containing protein [Patescibacteria group bacterium]|nr:AbrB/MazE/SpoVT family DNA-binding domain-containing protein [Patescibacteria group bacterium]